MSELNLRTWKKIILKVESYKETYTNMHHRKIRAQQRWKEDPQSKNKKSRIYAEKNFFRLTATTEARRSQNDAFKSSE